MNTPLALVGVAINLFILVEGFETLVLPRRIDRSLRSTPLFYKTLWRGWRKISRLLPSEHRDNFLSIFGPLSLLLLLNVWACGLIVGFALLQWGSGAQVTEPVGTPNFGTYLYLSATTFITLGFGDVAPRDSLARILSDIEAGTGFGFLALVIGYFPVLYGAFSRREVEIALLDARASSPPSAGAMLQRVAVQPDLGDIQELLKGYERWSAELLESHLSYQVLMYYRSQHERQSWLSTLTTILDTCAILIAEMPDSKMAWQARMTFAISRHAAVDLAMMFDMPPIPPQPDRLPPTDRTRLCEILAHAGMHLRADKESEERLNELRGLYEPYLNALSQTLVLPLSSWLPNDNLPDNWQTSAWDRSDHFFRSDPRAPSRSALRQRQNKT